MSRIMLIVLCALAASFVLPASSQGSTGELGQRFEVKANGRTVAAGPYGQAASSPEPLAAGVSYDVRVTGAISLWSSANWQRLKQCGRPEPSTSGLLGLDAATRFGAPVSKTASCPALPDAHSLFKLSTDSGRTSFAPTLAPTGQPHTFTTTVTGTGAALQARVADTAPEDNYGSLSVEVVPTDPGGSPVPATARVTQGGSLSNGTTTGINTRSAHRITCDCSGLKIAWANWYIGEADGPNPVALTLSIEHPAGVYHPVTIGGERRRVLQPGETIVSDPVAGLGPIAAGDVVYVRAFLEVPQGGKWIRGLNANNAPAFPWVSGEGWTSSSTESDRTLAPLDTPTTSGAMPGPLMVLASGYASRPPSVASLGDSILFGALGVRGSADQSWLTVALDDRAGIVSLLRAGGQGAQFAGDAARRRLPLLQYPSALVTDFGINDLNGGAMTVDQVKSTMRRIWGLGKARGLRVYQSTLTPWTTSSDAWSTLEGQTPSSANANRVAINEWLRSGADGNTDLDGVLEVADQVESARNSGIWKPGLTADGVHPTVAADALIAKGIDVRGVLGG